MGISNLKFPVISQEDELLFLAAGNDCMYNFVVCMPERAFVQSLWFVGVAQQSEYSPGGLN